MEKNNSSKDSKIVSIIVPVYKKEATIVADIENIYQALKQSRWEFEIIVVIDGFVDKSFENAKKLKYPEVSVIGYEHNRGKGYAVRYGMAKASGKFIAFIDSGMDINPNGISLILEHMEWYKADIIVGSKRHPASKVKYSALRRVYSFCYQVLVFLLFRLKIRDTQVGLKVFRREVLERVLPRLVVKAFAFDVELLSVAYRLGFTKIYEAPVEVSLDFSSSAFNLKKPMFLDPQIRNILYDTVAVFYRMHFLKYYDDENRIKWVYDKELQMRVNTGEFLE